MMQSTAKTAPSSVPAATPGSTPTRKLDDLTYQAITVAAALLLLGSLWVF